MNKLFLPFEISLQYSPYFIFNLICSCLCWISFFLVLKKYSAAIKRPVAIVTILFITLYQIPLTALSYNFYNYLSPHWFFAITIHLITSSCIFYIYLTPQWNRLLVTRNLVSDLSFQKRTLVCIFASLGIFTFIFLYKIGFSCTGMYALLFDPELTLLAREVTTKLNYGSMSNLAYGNVANVLVPLLIVIAIQQIAVLLMVKKYFKITLWIFLSILSIFITLLPGAKGAIIPTIVAAITMTLLLNSSKKIKLILIVCFSVMLVGTMLTIELLKERAAVVAFKYDYAQCAKRANACEAAGILLSSLKSREMSLGVSASRLNKIECEFTEACGDKDVQCAKVESSNTFQNLDTVKSQIVTQKNQLPNKLTLQQKASRAVQYFYSILYRAGVVPIQVSSWYFQYVNDYGSPSLYAIPLAKYSNNYINMPNVINNTYSKIYSEGSQVSTGTVPTSFLMAYPSYWKWIGLIGALACLFVFEAIFLYIYRRLPIKLKFISLSLVTITCINFMVSDFSTVIISLGGAFGILFVYILDKLETSV